MEYVVGAVVVAIIGFFVYRAIKQKNEYPKPGPGREGDEREPR